MGFNSWVCEQLLAASFNKVGSLICSIFLVSLLLQCCTHTC